MSLIGLPEEVIEAYILPKVGWNDLLRLRRVCKVLHQITTDYVQVHSNLAPEIEINEGDKNLGAFLEMGVPSTKIFVNNDQSGTDFFQRNKENISRFLDKYGQLVKNLRVDQMLLNLYGEEWDFFDGLPNLESLEVGQYGIGPRAITHEERVQLFRQRFQLALKDPRFDNHIYPRGLLHMKSLSVGQGENDDNHVNNILARTIDWLKDCKNLEIISHPFDPWIDEKFGHRINRQLLEPQNAHLLAFLLMEQEIKNRLEHPDHANLKGLDFQSFHGVWDPPVPLMMDIGCEAFLRLCSTSLENDVKLLNVNSCWFVGMDRFPRWASPEVGKPVVSLVNLHNSLFPLEMPNLERVKVKATSQCALSITSGDEQRPDWPSLKCLDITVDTCHHEHLTHFAVQEGRLNVQRFFTRDIFNFCFRGVRRLALTELRLDFVRDGLPKVEVGDVVGSCPNLKKLRIGNWPGTNKSLIKLWEGCQALEEIELEYCKNVGNVTFVGVDTNNPVFFKLKNLKKLSLKGLDKMPKITDLLFSMVIRHLSLTHFLITSDEPVTSVTCAGIKLLLEGTFAKSIEKFPLNAITLADVQEEELKKIEKMFRSYDMI